MTVVTLDEARERLPELIRLMATGEKVVIADGAKWIAALGAPPPMPLTAEEELARQERVKGAIRQMVLAQTEAGLPPSAESKIWELAPTTPQELTAGDAAYLALVRDVVEAHERNGDPLPPDHPLRVILLRRAA